MASFERPKDEHRDTDRSEGAAGRRGRRRPRQSSRRSRQRGEPDWLTQRRLAAWTLAEALPMPTRDDRGLATHRPERPGPGHAARRSGLTGTAARTMRRAPSPTDLAGVAGSLRIEDGKVVERSLAPEPGEEGRRLTSLRQARQGAPGAGREASRAAGHGRREQVRRPGRGALGKTASSSTCRAASPSSSRSSSRIVSRAVRLRPSSAR